MKSTLHDIVNTAVSSKLTCQQKLFNLANIAERLVDPEEVLGYSEKETEYIEKGMICDLNEGYAIYRPRYIVPDYMSFLKHGCKFLDIRPPEDLDELLDNLLIFYHHVPSITSFPVFIGPLDLMIDPFINDEKYDYIKIKRFLNHIDKTITDSFCHADIGPKATNAGKMILKAIVELENPTPNMTLRYDPDLTDPDFAQKAAAACLKVSKPSFSNEKMYRKEMGEHEIVSCYNALPSAGGAYTLPRLRLGTIAQGTSSLDELLNQRIPDVSETMLSMMDKRIKFLVEKSNFFESSFLVSEGFIKRENFTAMFGIVGLAEAVNHILYKEKKDEHFGMSSYGDDIAHKIMRKIQSIVNNHKGIYVERTNNRYLLHGQVGANLSHEDYSNTPAHRVPVGDEPSLPKHIKQAGQFHKYFESGTGDLFAFDQTYTDKPEAILDIINGAMDTGYRYITTYLENTDLIRVTGYLIKKSEAQKVADGKVVLRDTAIMGEGTNQNAKVFKRKIRR